MFSAADNFLFFGVDEELPASACGDGRASDVSDSFLFLGVELDDVDAEGVNEHISKKKGENFNISCIKGLRSAMKLLVLACGCCCCCSILF